MSCSGAHRGSLSTCGLRCGTATTEAKYQPAPLPRKGASSSRTLIWVVLAIVIAALAAFYLLSGMQ